VQAVKEVRLATGLGRKEAKQLVDALRDGPLADSDHRGGARWRAASRIGPGGSTPVDTSVQGRGEFPFARAARSARPEGPAPTPHARRACRSGRPAAARSAVALI
jgi:hypothetical protein